MDVKTNTTEMVENIKQPRAHTQKKKVTERKGSKVASLKVPWQIEVG